VTVKTDDHEKRLEKPPGIFKSLFLAFLAWAIGLNYVVFADKAPASSKTGNSFYVGVCTHFSQNKGIVEMNIRSMKNAGIAAIRDEVGWSAIEREKGKLVMPERLDQYVRSASQAGLDVMLILDYSNLERTSDFTRYGTNGILASA